MSRDGRLATLDDVPDGYLDSLALLGFDWLWLLGIWQTGEAARTVSRSHADWVNGYKSQLPDLRPEDITGSPFAIKNYTACNDFGGDEALARFRQRLAKRGMKLLLDFVPNHTAPDHPWVFAHPEYYIGGSDDDLAREPGNYRRVDTRHGTRVIAYGRDPYFPGWPDTLQVNYRSTALRKAMIGELERISTQCDGLRCDMAMLPLPDVILRTWGERSRPGDGSPAVDSPFWLEALPRVRGKQPSFTFMAEVYWDREYDLQQQGFDYTYDKRLYDRLESRQAQSVRGHLCADPEFQKRSVRFLENHDEPRAAASFPDDVHRAAAVLAFLVPGMRFFHEGQLEGRRVHVSMHLGRRPSEPVDEELRAFYLQLLAVLKSPIPRDGDWQLLECHAAWEDNVTAEQFIAFSWQHEGSRLLAAVNFGPAQGQCYIPVPWHDLAGKPVMLCDRLTVASYERSGEDLQHRGLYLDLPPWGYHVFEVRV